MTELVVAATLSKKGGPCQDCKEHIPKGGIVVKIWSEGAGTRWVCWKCGRKVEETR